MKTTILIILFFASTVPAVFAQANNDEAIIANIRKEFTAINAAAKKYKIDSAEVEGLSTEGGNIKKYYDGSVLRKALLTLYAESGQMFVEYYFSNNQLIFAYEKNESNDKLVYQGKTKVVSTTEQRYYFNNQHLIRWIEDKKIVDKSKYAEKEKEILSDLSGDLKLIP